MTDRGLDSANMTGDLWPIGFDVDIALDSSTKNAFNSLNCNMLPNSNNGTPSGYADVQQMFFNKLNDFNERDISQITDLTNSLPKADNSQNLYAKFSCQELANELASGHDPVPKDQNLFGSSGCHEGLVQKPVYSMDIFGKVAFQDGKLTLQLKNFQMAPHFSNNIEECWICKEKLLLSNIECHKHSLNGLFQINTEYVQIDIDQYGSPLPTTTSNIMKLPITNLDIPAISGQAYQPFEGRLSTETECCQLTLTSDVNQCKNKVGNVHSTKTIDDISFTPSLVSHDISHQMPPNNFINVNLSNIDIQNDRQRSVGSNLVNSDSPYLLPNVHNSDAILMDKSRPQHIYGNDPRKQIETYQNLFSDQCHYGELPNGNKSFVEITNNKTTPVQHETKVEVGAKKRKSKLTSKKSSIIKMRDESEKTQKFDPPATQDTILSNIHQTSNIPVAVKNTESSPKLKKKLRLSCYLCTNVYKSEASYVEHILIVHEVPKSDLFSCLTCCKKFETAKSYLLHVKCHRPKLACGICGKSYGRLEKLNRHIDSAHHAKKPHRCSFCAKAFSRSEYLKAHLNIHTGTKFDCDLCSKSFSSKNNLNVHKKIHSNSKSHKCEDCGKCFSRRDFLKMHVQSDHKNEKFECDVCFKLFSRNDVLKRHKMVHENARVKHSCHICKKSYSRKHILSTHLKTHDNTIVLKCDLCPGTFKKKQSLQKHLKIHKIKEQCNICYKFLPSSQRLQNHLIWHEKQLKLRFEREYFGTVKCESCPKSFSSQQLLNRHVTRSHKQAQDTTGSLQTINERQKKFFCEHCSKGFTRSCNLKAHVKTHNESDDEDVLAELPSVLSAAKSCNSKSKNSSIGDKDSKYMRLENYNSKIDEINHLSASTFPTPLEHLPNISNSNHNPYATHAYDNSPASTYLNSGSPTSPINLSAEAITAAAYLLAYPSYSGQYH